MKKDQITFNNCVIADVNLAVLVSASIFSTLKYVTVNYRLCRGVCSTPLNYDRDLDLSYSLKGQFYCHLSLLGFKEANDYISIVACK